MNVPAQTYRRVVWASLCLSLFPVGVQARSAVVAATGVGPGADKAAAMVEWALAEALRADSAHGYTPMGVGTAAHDPSVGRAKQALTRAAGLRDKARTSFDSLDLDAAESALTQAARLQAHWMPYVDDFADTADVLLLLGAVQVLKGNEAAGMAAFEQAQLIYPKAVPDTKVFNPTMRAQFAKAGENLAARGTSTLSVDASPPYGAVFVDAVFRGISPVTLENLPEGTHDIQVRRLGLRPWGKIVTTRRGHESAVSADMQVLVQAKDLEAFIDQIGRLDEDEMDSSAGQRSLRGAKNFVGSDALIVCQVRLDGERVKVQAALLDDSRKTPLKVVAHVFNYDTDIATYSREMQVLWQAGLMGDADGRGAPTQERASAPDPAGLPAGRDSAPDADVIAAGGKVRSRKASCGALSCQMLPKVVGGTIAGVGGVVVVIGAVEWVMAGQGHKRWRSLPQVASNSRAVRNRAYNSAVVGDVMVGAGLAVTLAGILTATLWHPAAKVVDSNPELGGSRRDRHGQTSPSRAWPLALGVAPIPQGMMASGAWAF